MGNYPTVNLFSGGMKTADWQLTELIPTDNFYLPPSSGEPRGPSLSQPRFFITERLFFSSTVPVRPAITVKKRAHVYKNPSVGDHGRVRGGSERPTLNKRAEVTSYVNPCDFQLGHRGVGGFGRV